VVSIERLGVTTALRGEKGRTAATDDRNLSTTSPLENADRRATPLWTARGISLADAGVVTGVGVAPQGRERGARGHAICSGTAPEFVGDQHSRPVLSLIVRSESREG
jgi:hypothetical protein